VVKAIHAAAKQAIAAICHFGIGWRLGFLANE